MHVPTGELISSELLDPALAVLLDRMPCTAARPRSRPGLARLPQDVQRTD